MLSTEETLRLTVAALMSRTGERQGELGERIGLSQTQVSRKQSGRVAWTLTEVDRLAAHWGIPVLDLLAGPTHAASKLPHDRIAEGRQPSQAALSAQLPLPAAAPGGPPPPAAVPVPATVGQPAAERLGADQAPQERPRVARPVRERPAEEHLAVEQPAGERPRAERPAVEQPAEERPAVERPVVERPAAGEPAAELPAVEPAPLRSPARDPEPTATRHRARPVPHLRPPAGPLSDAIRARVAGVLREHGGDVDAARAALLKGAVPDVMALFAASRVGGRYEHSEFPPTQDILKKRTQKGADQIWEGRPKWRAGDLHRAAREGSIRLDVTALDMNAAYLSALKTHLPIGKLVHSEGGDHDGRRSGVHRVTPAPWTHPDLPNPLGARKEPGDLWITEPTLRLLLRCVREGLCDAPVIHESWTSGGSEALLEKLRRALAEVRREAIAREDDVTVDYVKSMYSKFVSTIGESSANRDIRRPDWMHIIRSQAFVNLWLKAHKAHNAGLTVVEMSGTDELHIAGEWESVFTEGRDLAQVKPKHTYTLGEGR